MRQMQTPDHGRELQNPDCRLRTRIAKDAVPVMGLVLDTNSEQQKLFCREPTVKVEFSRIHQSAKISEVFFQM